MIERPAVTDDCDRQSRRRNGTGRLNELMYRGPRRFWLVLALLPSVLVEAEEVSRQSMDNAWWTGPLLAASASTLPRGHFLVEPYLYDVIAYGHYTTRGRRVSVPHENDLGSQSYLLYGLVDRVSIGLIPRFGFREESQGPSSSGIGIGDLSLQAQYRLTQFREGHWVPTTSIVLAETFPTGRYDRLDRHPADGFGAGAHTTTVSLYSQDYFWLSTGRILRTRLNLSYAFSNKVALKGASVYGTNAGFEGRASPGDSFTADSSWEYSVTRNWVLALDVVYEHDASTSVVGNASSSRNGGTLLSEVQESSGMSRSLGFAPAVEYNWNARIGVIAGVRVIPIGHNASATVTPVAAINMVF
jgi:hypothetical protein